MPTIEELKDKYPKIAYAIEKDMSLDFDGFGRSWKVGEDTIDFPATTLELAELEEIIAYIKEVTCPPNKS
jgi:hypothetical protein